VADGTITRGSHGEPRQSRRSSRARSSTDCSARGPVGGLRDNLSPMDARITEVSALRRQGANRNDIRVATRRLTRLCAGSYAPTPENAEEGHVLRAVALVRRLDAVAASHTTAAVAWGLPVPREQLATVHLSVLEGRRGHAKSGRGYRIHPRPVEPSALVMVGSLACTDLRATVLDCARLLDVDWGVVVADAALHRHLTSLDDLRAAAASLARLRGVGKARMLAHRASANAESPGESLARVRLTRAGYVPAQQVQLADVPGAPRVDFLIDDWLVVEFDGRAKYELSGDVPRAHWEEKQRHDRIVEAGYEILRITWADLWDEPRLAERLARALRRSLMRRGRPA
jgi:very-short-patch-repair endonuclease